MQFCLVVGNEIPCVEVSADNLGAAVRSRDGEFAGVKTGPDITDQVKFGGERRQAVRTARAIRIFFSDHDTDLFSGLVIWNAATNGAAFFCSAAGQYKQVIPTRLLAPQAGFLAMKGDFLFNIFMGPDIRSSCWCC